MIGILGSVVVASIPQSASAYAGAHRKMSIKGKVRQAKVGLGVESKNFPAGVMAGDAEPTRVVLWTKYTGNRVDSLKVVIRKIEDDGRRYIPVNHVNMKFSKNSIEGGKWLVHVDVPGPSSGPGLEPGKFYDYCFLEDFGNGIVKRSRRGHFRTALDELMTENVKFGGTSCTYQFDRPFKGIRRFKKRNLIDYVLKRTNKNLTHAAKKTKLSFFLHAGDQVYCDQWNGKPDKKSKRTSTPEQYQRKYEHAFSWQGLRRLHEAFGMYTTWDDHEVFDGWGDDGRDKDFGDLTEKNVIDNGKRSFFEHQPICTFPAGKAAASEYRFACDEHPTIDPPSSERDRDKHVQKLWSSFRWGRMLEIFILDCRSERDEVAKEYISKEQQDWLIEGLHRSPAVFKFILNSTPVGFFPDQHQQQLLLLLLLLRQGRLQLRPLSPEQQRVRIVHQRQQRQLLKWELLRVPQQQQLLHYIVDEIGSLLNELAPPSAREGLRLQLPEEQPSQLPQEQPHWRDLLQRLQKAKQVLMQLLSLRSQYLLPERLKEKLMRLQAELQQDEVQLRPEETWLLNKLGNQLKHLPVELPLLQKLQEQEHLLVTLLLQLLLLQKLLRKEKKREEKKKGYRWDAPWLDSQRHKVLSAARCVGGVCWLSGDLHYGSIGTVGLLPRSSPLEDYSRVGEVLMGPGGQRSKRSDRVEQFAKLWPKHWSFATTENNYVVIKVDAKLDENGSPDKDNSTFTISFFGIRQRWRKVRRAGKIFYIPKNQRSKKTKTRLLYSEKRGYNMELK